jgi:hypothetical protein
MTFLRRSASTRVATALRHSAPSSTDPFLRMDEPILQVWHAARAVHDGKSRLSEGSARERVSNSSADSERTTGRGMLFFAARERGA